jgi:hypothetical protein
MLSARQIQERPRKACPLCRGLAAWSFDGHVRDEETVIVECASCRRFTITGATLRALRNAPRAELAALTQRSREAWAAGGRFEATDKV